MATSPHTRFCFDQVEPLPGYEDPYEAQKWQIVDVKCRCENCGLKSKNVSKKGKKS